MTDIGSTAPVTFTGIESGLNTEQIMSAYLQIDEAPLTQLENQQTTVNNQVSAYQTIEQQLQALQTAADQVSARMPSRARSRPAPPNSSVATATTGTGATPGSTTFSVDQLATADTLVSSGTVASVNDVVASGNLLIASGASALGIGSISGTGLTTGAHTIAVTQASAGASVVGSSAIASSTQITASNDQLSVSIDGTASSFTIANGTYTAQQLASAVGTASGGLLTATINNAGQLVLATSEQGSQATLQIGAGSANGALGLSAGGAVSGTDGVITVDGQANTVTDIAATGSTPVTLSSGSGGSVQANLAAGGLTAGSITAQNVSVGNGSLASVVSAINAANVGRDSGVARRRAEPVRPIHQLGHDRRGERRLRRPFSVLELRPRLARHDDGGPGRRHKPRRTRRLRGALGFEHRDGRHAGREHRAPGRLHPRR